MTVGNLAFVAFVAISLNGLFVGIAYRCWQEARRLRGRNERLLEELAASRKWNDELVAARSEVGQLVDQDPMQLAPALPHRNDILWQLYRLPAVTPDHERGQQ